MKFKNIISSIGGSKQLKIEQRIFNITSFNLFLFTIIALCVNIIIEINTIVIIATSFAGIISFYFYYLSRLKAYSSARLIPYYIVAVISLLSIMYFYNGGIGGTVIFLIFTLLNILVLIAEKTYQYIIATTLYGCILLLLVIEYNYPDLIVGYNSREEKFIDQITTILYSVIFTTLIIVKFKEKMEDDRLQIIKSNQELKDLNQQIYQQKKEVEDKKQELEGALFEIQQRNEFIETLLKELNHRVKNNLQLVIGLIDLQLSRESVQNINSPLQVTKNRLLSLILAHQRLYEGNENAINIYMPDYIKQLSQAIQAFYINPVDDKQFVTANIDAIYLNVRNAISLGLIINEIITNAFKHAFVSHSDPKILIHFTFYTKYILKISDNGIGYDEQSVKPGTGTSIIRSLVKQLSGHLVVRSEKGEGTSYQLEFD